LTPFLGGAELLSNLPAMAHKKYLGIIFKLGDVEIG